MNAILTSGKAGIAEPLAPINDRQEGLRETFILKNRQGLHCRPAALLVRTLVGFQCRVTVESNGADANARSIFELMGLAAGYGSRLTFAVTGRDAPAAMAALRRLFESDFAEAYLDSSPPDGAPTADCAKAG